MEKEILDLYKNGVSISKISKKLNISPYKISGVLMENGIEIVNKQNLIKFNLEKDVLPLYNNGYSLTEISKIVGNSRQCIAKHLKLRGIEVVNRQNLHRINETIFDVIDTEEKAYWLGFLYADGYVSNHDKNKNRNVIELTLALNDFSHIKKFVKFIGDDDKKLKFKTVTLNGKEKYSCRWFCSNKHLWQTLVNYGCVPTKSKILEFPNKEVFVGDKEKLIISFFHGYFDGDGCLSYTYHITKEGKKVYSAVSSVISTKNMLENFCKYVIGKESNITPANKGRTSNEKTFVLTLSQKETQILINKFYCDTTIYLERKYNRAMFFKDTCRSSEELEELLRGEIGEQTFF